ncbi:MAG: hypothetical protein ACLQMF_20220 [Rectinemataceae bacterium]
MKVGDSVTYYLRQDGHEFFPGHPGATSVPATIARVNGNGTAVLSASGLFIMNVAPGTFPGQFSDSST